MPIFRYTVDDATIEHRVSVSASEIVQSFVVRNPSSEVSYVGDAENPFASETGEREGDVVRFPKDDVVEFEIKMLLENKK